jgi:Asp-tRNA(Asn)/Glu-tRNA(Gln) amidotransferase A subunit family amidase
MTPADLCKYDALGLAELIRNREASPTELLDATLARMEEVNGRLNAVIFGSTTQGKQRRGLFRVARLVVCHFC